MVTVSSELVDYLIQIGMAVHYLGIISVARSDIEVRLLNGRLEATSPDNNYGVGTYGVHPTARDWEYLAMRVGTL